MLTIVYSKENLKNLKFFFFDKKNSNSIFGFLTSILLSKCVGWAPHAFFYMLDLEEGQSSQRGSQSPSLMRIDHSLEMDQMENGRRFM